MCSYFDRRRNFTSAQYFYQRFFGYKAVLMQEIHINYGHVELSHQSLYHVKVHRLVFNPVDIFETEFRYPALKRHLTTFKAPFGTVTRAGPGSFVAAGGSTSFAGSGTTSNTLTRLNGT